MTGFDQFDHGSFGLGANRDDAFCVLSRLAGIVHTLGELANQVIDAGPGDRRDHVAFPSEGMEFFELNGVAFGPNNHPWTLE